MDGEVISCGKAVSEILKSLKTFSPPIKTRIRLILTSLLGKDFSYLQSQRLKVLENVDIISFDVFDTLILRPEVSIPSDVFSLIYPQDGYFKARRIEAERVARSKALEQGREDISLCEIYKALYPTHSDSELEEAMALEINTELRVCNVNPEALALFRSIQNGKYGKKHVIITSDMYLSRDVIFTILTSSGFDLEGVDIFISSEYGLTKRSGSLFKKVMELEPIEPKCVLHIGDNLISDYLKPRKCGMRSFLYSAQNLGVRPH